MSQAVSVWQSQQSCWCVNFFFFTVGVLPLRDEKTSRADWGEIFVNHRTDKGSRMYKELSTLNNKKENKYAREKRFDILVIRKMQIKTTVRYHCASLEWLKRF